MKIDVHDIRLLAGFEIEPSSITQRVLSREQIEAVAGALAADLADITPGVEQALLVACGSLLEAPEMLRPGLPVWAGMADLAAPLLREAGPDSQLLAIGSHAGNLPDRRLAPPQQAIQGHFIGIPLLLAVTTEAGPALEERLESELFDRGGVAPPARALLEEFTGARSAHGQLLTVNDLLALQHVQMDVAGLSAFWPVVEQALLAPQEDADFDLPAGLAARWQAETRRLDIRFVVFDRYAQAPHQYPLWQRAFRSLTGLADAHGLSWQIEFDSDLVHDSNEQALIHDAGATDSDDGVTEQSDPNVGLIAWTIAENGRLRHIYPLSQAAVDRLGKRFVAQSETIHQPARLCHDGDPPRLSPA